jgi:SAM-dependent methyltransferase
MATTTGSYTLDNGWALARHRLDLLEACFDAGTVRRLSGLGVGPGWRCLEVGAGGGSITRWLCGTVGQQGQVTAVDVDTRFLEGLDPTNLDVLRMDVTTDELPDEAFDLVHARTLLVHLSARERVLDRLVASLRPGGVLLVEEPDHYPIEALGAGLYRDGWMAVFGGTPPSGIKLTWARALPALLHERGLAGVAAESESQLFEGGSVYAELLRLTVRQLQEAGHADGTPGGQQEAWDDLLQRPGRWFPGLGLVGASGRKGGRS